jgi:tRNA A37 threonylcarbamoyladenosine synthetase subunit TsaC/SUA5/YrdC
MTHTIIEKEELQTLHFATTEVLTDAAARIHRKNLLHEAMMLGNDFKQKVRIIFQTTEGIYAVETTVWAATDSHIELKAGKDMPIHCILEVVI